VPLILPRRCVVNRSLSGPPHRALGAAGRRLEETLRFPPEGESGINIDRSRVLGSDVRSETRQLTDLYSDSTDSDRCPLRGIDPILRGRRPISSMERPIPAGSLNNRLRRSKDHCRR
jgi:hypothetical protein